MLVINTFGWFWKDFFHGRDTVVCRTGSGGTYLLRGAVLDDFRAQIAAFDGAQILLVAFPIAVILIHHVGIPGLRLGSDDGMPQLLSRDSSLVSSFPLISEEHKIEKNVQNNSEIHEGRKEIPYFM